MLRAADIMKKDVRHVSPETSLTELGKMFIKYEISGMPVMDPEGKLIGMITENDLISRSKRLHIPTVLRIFDAFIPMEGFGSLEKEIRKMTATVVSEICTRDVITIGEDTSIEDIATIMSEKKVHHLPVVRDGRVIGIVGKHEVIEGIAGDTSDAEP